MYTISGESFLGREHLERIKTEAQEMVDGVLRNA
jgi:phosphoglucomutase